MIGFLLLDVKMMVQGKPFWHCEGAEGVENCIGSLFFANPERRRRCPLLEKAGELGQISEAIPLRRPDIFQAGAPNGWSVRVWASLLPEGEYEAVPA